MWINFKFLHMTDVEKSKISFILCTIYGILLHFTLTHFFRWQFTLFCRKSILRFTHFCVEKNLAKNSARGEKNDKYEVWMKVSHNSYYHTIKMKASHND